MNARPRLADLAGSTALAFLQRLPPETAHGLALRALGRGWAGRRPQPTRPRLATRLLGFEVPHPLGLAAGFDKNAEAVTGLFGLGFAFVEIGTVTPRPQAGNQKPRLFRLRPQRALINRMGFNNDGLEVVRARLAALGPRPGPLGANIGSNRDSADPVADYVTCLRGLYPLVDYIAVNVSSPNTPGLRDLQRRDRLEALLNALLAARTALAASSPAKPLLLKIAPDLSPEDEADIAEVALALGIDGLIVSNTTVARPDVVTGPLREEAGGLSGTPLFLRATEQLGRFYRMTGGRLPLIGVGGITTGADAYAKIRAGAAALQLYTALIYQGPGVIERVLGELDRLLAEDGYARISDATGADRRD
ncbi:MAG TPA: quinone-dependent dihydroorotate dehydrogenase [Geminicoccaceae bacterium]|nr:quinone-dependent dihydroorotate dehydrogenase [Geminicoccaceae bacterium]